MKNTGNPFLSYREQFEADLDGFYSTCPADISEILEELDREKAENPGMDKFTEKALTYEAAEEDTLKISLYKSMKTGLISMIGTVDRMLKPFLLKDLEAETITLEEARELLSVFLLYTEVKFECRKAPS